MSERWCPECEVTYRGIECPTCLYVHPDDEEALEAEAAHECEKPCEAEPGCPCLCHYDDLPAGYRKPDCEAASPAALDTVTIPRAEYEALMRYDEGRAAEYARRLTEQERGEPRSNAATIPIYDHTGASPAALDALERAVIDAAIRVHDSQQASGSTLAPGERGIGGQMMTAWIRAEPFEELLDATYALLRERDRARLAQQDGR